MERLVADLDNEAIKGKKYARHTISFNQAVHAHRPVHDETCPGDRDDIPSARYVTPDVVFAVARAPFHLMDETKVRSATSKAWGSEFSVEADDEDGVGIWKDIKLPMLIAEYIKDEDLDHRGHLVMTMKSALAAYRLYHMKQEVVFGLLIDRDIVSLSVGWGSEDGQYATTKDYFCSNPTEPTTKLTFHIRDPLDALRLRLTLFNLYTKAVRIVLTAEDEDQKNAYLKPFQRDEVPEHVRWKHAMNEADTSDLDSDASESDGDVGSGASERSDWTE
ncbi:hypothetical protein C8Q76DRAFT_459416 [Earliella scabrosa]|nr:hypothetical protein C8Q76DRAFT_459416 [Earliella scabrosa]